MNLIQGRPLVGFYGIFEENFGKPTNGPMPTVTPSFVGNSLLPFRCPSCQRVCQELACTVTREHYADPRPGRDNHFCHACGCRFRIDLRGVKLPCALAPGADVAPSMVDGVWQDVPEDSMIDAIGTIFGTIFGSSQPGRSGYEILGERRTQLGYDDDSVLGASLWNWFRPRREIVTAPMRVVVSPPKGASTAFISPQSVSVSGGSRSIPPRSFSADTIYYDKPTNVTVVPANGMSKTFRPGTVGYLQIYGGRSTR